MYPLPSSRNPHIWVCFALSLVLIPAARAVSRDCVIRSKDGKPFAGQVEAVPGGFLLKRSGRPNLFFRTDQVRMILYERNCPGRTQRTPRREPMSPARKTAPTVRKIARKYHGEPLDLFVRDAPLADVLRALADQAGLSLVLPPGLEGTVDLDLKQVPWDQILDLLARMHHFMYRVEDHILIVLKKSQ